MCREKIQSADLPFCCTTQPVYIIKTLLGINLIKAADMKNNLKDKSLFQLKECKVSGTELSFLLLVRSADRGSR